MYVTSKSGIYLNKKDCFKALKSFTRKAPKFLKVRSHALIDSKTWFAIIFAEISKKNCFYSRTARQVLEVKRCMEMNILKHFEPF